MENHQRSEKIESLLVQMGAHGFFKDLQAEQATGGLSPIVDPETLKTIQDMENLQAAAVKAQDFELLSRLNDDLQEVRQIGIKVSQLRGELKDNIYNEDFGGAIQLKEVLKRIEARRDVFDARYETSRYEEMIVMPGEPE